MKNRRFLVLTILCLISLTLNAGGSAEARSEEGARPLIAVSILPQQYVVDRIAGDLADTVVLVGPGQSPHAYEPTPRQMSYLSQADAWILSNTDFEKALASRVRALYPELLVVDGTGGVTFRYLEEHEEEHEHHDQDEDSIELDRHTWLGREPMKLLGLTIARTLISLDKEHESTYRRNLEGFHTEVDAVFDDLARELAALKGTTVLVYHPSFGYLLDEFGITQEAVETGGKEPTARALADLIERAEERGVTALFVQAQFSTNAARNVAQAIGAEVLPLDPLAYDLLGNIRVIGETLARSLLPNTQGDR